MRGGQNFLAKCLATFFSSSTLLVCVNIPGKETMMQTSWPKALLHTPFWVWGVLVYMIYVGVRALRPQKVYPPVLLLVPALLMGFKFPVFFSRAPHLYIGMLAFGFMIGWISAKKMPIRWQHFPRRLILPGSPTTLVVLMVFFSTKYTYGLMHALYPDQAAGWSWLDTGISGLLPGYSWAKGIFLSYRFFSAHPKY